MLRYAKLRSVPLIYAMLRYATLRYTTPTPEGLVLYYINRIVSVRLSVVCVSPIFFLTTTGTDMRFFAKVDKFMWAQPKTKFIFAPPLFDPFFRPKPDPVRKKRSKMAYFRYI